MKILLHTTTPIINLVVFQFRHNEQIDSSGKLFQLLHLNYNHPNSSSTNTQQHAPNKMRRIKKQHTDLLTKAKLRIDALRSIDPSLDLGNGRNLVAYETVLFKAQNNLNDFSKLLSSVEEANAQLKESEQELATWNDAMLAGIAQKYGKNSREYLMASGKRKTERSKSARKSDK